MTTLDGVLGILWFRTLPIVGFMVVTREVKHGRKALALAAFVGFSFLLRVWRLAPLAPLLIAYGWFIALSMIVPLGGRLLRSEILTRGGLFVACASAFFVFPALLLPGGAKATILVLGWELMLSSYSFCVESAVGQETPSRADCSFFLLVNPALVYTRRGARMGPPAFDARGMQRTVLGLMMLLIAIGVLVPAYGYVRAQAPEGSPLHDVLVLAIAFGALRWFAEYWQHAGVANLQIGLMRQIGHAVPERYLYPFAATSPMDFWSRWNTYVADWMSLYVFSPLVTPYRRTRDERKLRVVHAAAVVVTFLALGAFHLAPSYVLALGREWRGLTAYAGVGVIVAGWSVASRLGPRAKAARFASRWARGLSSVPQRIILWALIVACTTWMLG